MSIAARKLTSAPERSSTFAGAAAVSIASVSMQTDLARGACSMSVGSVHSQMRPTEMPLSMTLPGASANEGISIRSLVRDPVPALHVSNARICKHRAATIDEHEPLTARRSSPNDRRTRADNSDAAHRVPPRRCRRPRMRAGARATSHVGGLGTQPNATRRDAAQHDTARGIRK